MPSRAILSGVISFLIQYDDDDDAYMTCPATPMLYLECARMLLTSIAKLV